MKALKIVVLSLVGVIALVAILLGLALTPSIQTWATRKAVAGQPGLTLELSRVSAGLSSADLTDVHMVKDGIVITAKHVVAKYSAWDFMTHHRITVDDLTVDGLVVDLKAATAATSATPTATKSAGNASSASSIPATAAKPSTPFQGVLGQIQLPYDVHVTRFSVPGRVLLPDNRSVTFELRGNDITTGQRGTIDWKADLTDSSPKAAFKALHSSGTVQIHLTSDRRIDLVEVTSLAAVEGTNLPSDQVKLSAKVEQTAVGGNEAYTADVLLVRGASAEPLVTLGAQFNAVSHEISGAWKVSVRSEQLGALLAGLGLPDVAAQGAGKFAALPERSAATANGELTADLTHLDKLSPQLAAVGALHIQTDFDGALADNVAKLERFTLVASGANGKKIAEIAVLQRIGYSLADQRISFADAKADLARISVQSLPLAWAQPFLNGLTIDSGDLSLALAISAEADGSHVRVVTAEPVTLRNVTVRNGTQKLAEALTLSVKPLADYSPEKIHAELNELAVSMPTGDTVNGRFTVDVTNLKSTPTIAFTTDTQAKFVAALKPYLNIETGPILVSTQSQGSMVGQSLSFTRSSTRITRASGPMLTTIELQQPITLNLQTNAITSAKPEADVLRVQLGQIPLAWAEAFVPGARISGQLDGGTIGVGVRGLDSISAAATTPIRVTGIGVIMNGQTMLQNVDFSADFAATKLGDAIHYDLRQIEAHQGSASLFRLVVTGDMKIGAKPTIIAKGTFDADLAALALQPVAAAQVGLEKGILAVTFDATITETIQAKATVTARQLVAKQNHQALGEAELKVEATVQSDGSSLLKVPFVLTSGQRKSDLAIEGKLGRDGNRITFDGRIISERLVIDDLQLFAALSATPPTNTTAAKPVAATTTTSAATKSTKSAPVVATTPAATPTTPATSAGPDKEAFWAVAGGKLELNLKRIEYGHDYVVSAVHGAASITPKQLLLSTLEGKLKDNPFKMTAQVDFNSAQEKPYTLAATTTVTNLDVGAILQSANPNEKPQLETNVTVDAKLSSRGTSLSNLALNTYGSFDLTGSKGVLRALSRKGGQAVNVGSSLLGLVGAVKGSDTTVAVADLAKRLEELPFDKFVLHAERAEDLSLKIGKIEFLSPDTHILGSGDVGNQAGVALENQPLKVVLSLAGKDSMAVLLNRTKLLSGKQDDQGYSTMGTNFTVSGTVSSPNSNDLWRIIAEAGVKAAAGRFLGQ